MKQPVLITGGTGMIGLNLIEKLVSIGIKPYVLYRHKKKILPLSGLKNKITFIKVDLYDQIKLVKIINKIKPKTIFHLAASFFNPPNLSFNDHINLNVVTTLNLLVALKNVNLKNFIFSNTGAIYGTGLNLKEKTKIRCLNDYSLSKYLASNLVIDFAKKYNFLYKELRFFSIYGKWEKKHRLVCGALLKALKKKKYKILSSNQLRDYLNVEDIIEALLMSASTNKNLVLNICSGKKQSIYDLVKKIYKKLNSDSKLILISSKKNKNNTINKLVGNNQKAKHILKWHPKIPLQEGLDKTIKWLKLNKDVNTYLKI